MKLKDEKYIGLQQPVYKQVGSMNCWLGWQELLWGVFSLHPLLFFSTNLVIFEILETQVE